MRLEALESSAVIPIPASIVLLDAGPIIVSAPVVLFCSRVIPVPATRDVTTLVLLALPEILVSLVIIVVLPFFSFPVNST